MVENLGWENFFYLCTLLALPGMALLIKVAPWTNHVNDPLLKQDL
jgi:PAT family beta-lactamase induction signal transducer AmpG